jgi:hypothetical protein
MNKPNHLQARYLDSCTAREAFTESIKFAAAGVEALTRARAGNCKTKQWANAALKLLQELRDCSDKHAKSLDRTMGLGG